MYKKFALIIGVFALLNASGLAATANTDASLVSNGKFETDGGSNWPADWPHPEGATWEKEGDIHFLRLAASQPDKMLMAYRQIAIPTPRPPALELRVRVRYAGVKVGSKAWFDARVMMGFKDASGQDVKPQPPAPNFHGDSKGAWVDRSVFFKVPEKAATLDIMPCLFRVAAGTLDVAECDVFPARADQLPPPPPMIPSETVPVTKSATEPPELHVVGNQLMTPDAKPVWLQGLCLDSMEWGAGGEHILQSIPVAIEQWHANVIRLPVKDNFWWGWGPWQKKGDNGMTYRKLVDSAVDEAASHGAYLVLDLHKFGAPTEADVAFWKDAALRYKDNPAVLFELFNEPHDISWKLWRYGGNLHDASNAADTIHVKENNEQMSGDSTVGIQALVDAVRSTGARNIVIAGGLGWSYDLSGVVTGYALEEHPGGDGIMYSHHNYPWKIGWKEAVLGAAAKYPIFVGEVGCPNSWDDFKFIKKAEQYETLGPGCTWPSDMIGMIQKYKLNWTGFSFHPKCGPMVISDWNYTPTPYWGIFVKEALAGKQFEMKAMR
jgi:hypothetical protein